MDTRSFIRYLSAKRTVDDRSLNVRVWQAMASLCPASPLVLEIGGGIGTMVERISADGLIRPRRYTMIDAQAELVSEARRRLSGFTAFPLELEASDLDSFLGSPAGPWDLVIANAFLDLVDAPRALDGMHGLAGPRGLYLFSITFDGMTSFEPELDRALDERISAAYHGTIDARTEGGRPCGDSRSGRHLLGLLPAAGYRVLEAGSSDWVVFPRDGSYAGDERFFLSCMLGFFQEALTGLPEVPERDLAFWLEGRRAQLAAGRLTLIVHQLDVLAGLA
jgi:hypothetical protein